MAVASLASIRTGFWPGMAGGAIRGIYIGPVGSRSDTLPVGFRQRPFCVGRGAPALASNLDDTSIVARAGGHWTIGRHCSTDYRPSPVAAVSAAEYRLDP